MNCKTLTDHKLFLFVIIFISALLTSSCTTHQKYKLILPALNNDNVMFDFPKSEQWTIVTNSKKKNDHTREWVIKGSTGLKTEWIISVSRLSLPKHIPSMVILKNVYALSKPSCRKTKFYPPKHDRISLLKNKPYFSYDSSIGFYICSKQIGKNYGTYTYQRIISNHNQSYAFTIELRTPPSKEPMKFLSKSDERLKTFLSRKKESLQFIENGIYIESDIAPKLIPFK